LPEGVEIGVKEWGSDGENNYLELFRTKCASRHPEITVHGKR
jgi:hypothetical protein